MKDGMITDWDMFEQVIFTFMVDVHSVCMLSDNQLID